jgi:hypothetical protein
MNGDLSQRIIISIYEHDRHKTANSRVLREPATRSLSSYFGASKARRHREIFVIQAASALVFYAVHGGINRS